jgi:hypothetical protein
MPRRFPIFQAPNPPLITAILAAAFARTAHGARAQRAAQLSRLALLVWAAEEITTGANWFRRSLGIASGAYVTYRLHKQTKEEVDASFRYTTSK